MNKLVDRGKNSLIVIEHNLDVIYNADWIIDIGPEGGIAGGQVIFEGTPEQLIDMDYCCTTTTTTTTTATKSYTGKYLKEYVASN